MLPADEDRGFRFGGVKGILNKTIMDPKSTWHTIFRFPKTPEQSNAMFDRSGKMLKELFTYARQLGITTCVGTEAPLNIPDVVKQHLVELGKDPADPKVIQRAVRRHVPAHQAHLSD